MSTCRSCAGSIVWAVTAQGKRIPLDAGIDGLGPLVPLVVEDGNLAIVAVHADGVPVVVVQMDGTHRTHFQTCPNAAQHRKPRR